MHDVLELSDRDADALSLYEDADGIWVTCTNGAHEVTVGPLSATDLSRWFRPFEVR
jgi:hypothetical protein